MGGECGCSPPRNLIILTRRPKRALDVLMRLSRVLTYLPSAIVERYAARHNNIVCYTQEYGYPITL